MELTIFKEIITL